MSSNYKRKEFFNTYTPANGSSDVVELDGCDVGTLQIVAGAIVGAKTFDSGEIETGTITFDTKANTDAGDYVVIYDVNGDAWAVYADLTGTDPEPTGAVWDSIPAGRKAAADISADTTAAEVSLSFVTAFNAITGFTTVVDLDDQADGTADYDLVVRGVATDAESFNEDDSGVGTMTVAITNQGVASEVNIVDSEITIPSHGYATGAPVVATTTGTLPAPLQLATTYYVIVVDSNTIQLAETLAEAQAGTFIELVDDGSEGAVNTLTGTAKAGSVQPQVTNVANPSDSDWVNKGTATTLTGGAQNVVIEYDRKEMAYSKFRVTIGSIAGSFDFKVIGNFKV